VRRIRHQAPTLIGCLFVKELRDFALLVASLRCLQQRNEIMQSFFVAVNNLSENFFSSTRRQPQQPPPDSCLPSTGNPHQYCFSTTSNTPPSLSLRRCVVQRGANTNASTFDWQVFFERTGKSSLAPALK
ncbi:hypothetical protein, partial [Ralstonia syzygii]